MRELGVERLSLFRRLAARPAARPRRGQRGRACLLRPAGRRAARGRASSPGFASTTGTCRRRCRTRAAGSTATWPAGSPTMPRLIARRFGDRVRRFATFNEPSVFTLFGYGFAWHPPGLDRSGGPAPGHPSREPGAWRGRRCPARPAPHGVARRHSQRAAGRPARRRRPRTARGRACSTNIGTWPFPSRSSSGAIRPRTGACRWSPMCSKATWSASAGRSTGSVSITTRRSTPRPMRARRSASPGRMRPRACRRTQIGWQVDPARSATLCST